MGARFPSPVQTSPGAHPASCTMGTVSFPAVKSGRGVTLTPHPFLVPWSWKNRAILPLPLWAVRPVQSLSACTRGHFTLALCLLSQSFWVTRQPSQNSYCCHAKLPSFSRRDWIWTWRYVSLAERSVATCLIRGHVKIVSFDKHTVRQFLCAFRETAKNDC